MPKLLFFIALTLLSNFGLKGQKISEVRFNIPYNYLPARGLDAELTTYTKRVQDPYRIVSRSGMSKMAIQESLNLRNFLAVSSGGHLLVEYKIGFFSTPSVKTESKVTETKDKEGKVVKSTSYRIEGTYTFPISLEVISHDGELIFETTVGYDEVAFVYPQKGWEPTSSSLQQKWSKERNNFIRGLQYNHLNSSLNSLNSKLRSEIDIQEFKETYYFETPKGKKDENVAEWQASVAAAIETLGSITSTEPINTAAMREALKPQTDFWSAQLNAYDPGDKKVQKYYHAAALNLATIELVLENSSTALQMATSLENDVKWGGYRSKTLKDRASSITTALSDYPNGSRHFPLRDLSQAMPLENPLYGREAPTVIIYDTLQAYVQKGGTKIEGTIIIPENAALRLAGKPNATFKDKDGNKVFLDPTILEGFGMGDYHYTVAYFDDNAKLKKRPNFMRIMEDGPKMKFLQSLGSYSDSTPGSVDFLQDKEGETYSLDPYNPRWLNWKKAFSKLFEDCPALSNSILAGDYGRNAEDIRAAVRAYNKGECALSDIDSE